jgi:Zn-dependent M28 family amino/carboxypeptidase
MGRVEVEGWVTHGAALRIFEMGGQDYEALKALAITPEFAAVPLGVSASVSIENDILRSASRNVVARLPGADRPDEVVMFTAHWDHLGTQPDLEGDQIFNGAFDNATGTAGLLQIANAFARRGSPPARSVVFLAVTAEEQGLLGSAHYAANPIYPTRNTVAVVNMDGINVDGPMNDITVVGHGNSELDMVLEAEADKVGRVLRPDPEPEKGFFYRSDHFSFAKVGIPALYTDAGIDHAEHGEAWTLERRADYTANRYHKPADEWDPTWDLSGAMDDLRLMYRVGLSLSLSDEWPNWTVGNEFRAIREADRVGG